MHTNTNIKPQSNDKTQGKELGSHNTEYEDNIPEYVTTAAREIYTALYTFLVQPTIPNPAGGQPIPWVSEIRIPAVKETNSKTGKTYTNVEAAWFDTAGIEDITVELASHWCQPPDVLRPDTKYAEGGIYWCINPVSPAYLENYGSQLQRRRTGTTRDVDIVARYWLPLDADAVRKDPVTGAPLSVVSSTDAEKANIAKLIAQVRDYLLGDLGWPEPVQVDTGNGYADFYALPGLPIPRCPDDENPGCMKYDAAADTLIRDVIHSLAYKFSNELGSIDDAVFNPSRIMKVPGTWARKAQHTVNRPHRASRIIYTPDTIIPVTLEQLQLVADQLAKPITNKAKTRIKYISKPEPKPASPDEEADQVRETPPPLPGPVEPTTEAERTKRIQRAKDYLAKVPHALSGVYNKNGQKGHDATFTGLGKVVRRFALTRDMAEEAVIDWNDACEPPWSEAELAHKLDNIYADTRKADDWGKYLETDNNPQPNTKPVTTNDQSTNNDVAEVNESTADPHRLARTFLNIHYRYKNYPTLVVWQDIFYRWHDYTYNELSIAQIKAEITSHCKVEFDAANIEAQTAWALAGGEGPRPTAIKVTKGIVNNVHNALASMCNLADIEQPTWLPTQSTAVGLQTDQHDPSADNIIAIGTALVQYPHIADFVLPATPRYFNTFKLPFEYQEPVHGYDYSAVGPPTGPTDPLYRIKTFTSSILGYQLNSQKTLQEYIGYILSNSIDFHKALMLIGPPRSGKGTIDRLITALIGALYRTGPRLQDLQGPFGLQPWIGKRYACFADEQIGHYTDISQVGSMLLKLTGFDNIDVHRKGIEAWRGKLLAKIIMCSNIVPRFTERSTALADRFLVIQLLKSFAGKEDLELFRHIEPELPQALHYYAAGYIRLITQGKFTTPDAISVQTQQTLRAAASPMLGWLEDWVYPPQYTQPLDRCSTTEARDNYVHYCHTELRTTFECTTDQFVRDLRALRPEIQCKKLRYPLPSGKAIQCLTPFRLRTEAEAAETADNLAQANEQELNKQYPSPDNTPLSPSVV